MSRRAKTMQKKVRVRARSCAAPFIASMTYNFYRCSPMTLRPTLAPTKPVALFARILATAILSITLASAQERSPEQLYKDALAADDRGDVSQAISLYEQLVKLQPDLV